MGEGKVCDVPGLSASLPEVCNSVWQENAKAWAVHESECQDINFVCCMHPRQSLGLAALKGAGL